MDPTATVLMLMLAVAVLALLASKIGVPYPTMMVVGGLVICVVLPGTAQIYIPPHLIFTLFLPPLLYGAAWQLSWKDFWSSRREIFLMAVGLVFFTTFGVAALAVKFIPGFGWASACALGAIISPPDAIAVTALTKRIKLPRRAVLLLEGESLVNDATALVALKFAMAAAMTGVFSIWVAAGQFVFVSAGGVVLGFVMGWFVAELHQRLRDPMIETTLTFLTPYATYLLGEQIGVSGVLATVVAGLYVSWRSPIIMKPQVRLEANAVWDFVLFIMNGFVFVMVGLALPSVINELGGTKTPTTISAALSGQAPLSFTTGGLIGEGMLLVAGMIVLRMAWVVAGAFLPWLLSKRVRATETKPSLRQSLLVGWTGMRGVVSLAAALALPIAHDATKTEPASAGFPNRAMIIFMAFFTILVTLVLQSLTLPAVVKLLGAATAEDEEAEEREARLYTARAAVSFLKDLTESTDAFGTEGKELLANYEHKILRLETGPVALPIAEVGIDTSSMDLHREVLSAERQAIVEMRANQKITTDIFRRLMADLDAEEMRLSGRE